MGALKKYDLLTAKETGEFSIAEEYLQVSANPQMVKDYLVAIRNNHRQWSASTKTRAEVSATGKKPHRQKGLGKARQGSIVAPQYRGGGIVFGPKPKFSQHTRINKKERRAAMATLLAEKIQSGKVIVLQTKGLDKPKTKAVQGLLEKLEWEGKRILFLGKANAGDLQQETLIYSMRNIPKTTFLSPQTLNGYMLAQSSGIVVLESVWEDLVDKILKKDK